jgi:hypothetical protein
MSVGSSGGTNIRKKKWFVKHFLPGETLAVCSTIADWVGLILRGIICTFVKSLKLKNIWNFHI